MQTAPYDLRRLPTSSAALDSDFSCDPRTGVAANTRYFAKRSGVGLISFVSHRPPAAFTLPKGGAVYRRGCAAEDRLGGCRPRQQGRSVLTDRPRRGAGGSYARDVLATRCGQWSQRLWMSSLRRARRRRCGVARRGRKLDCGSAPPPRRREIVGPWLTSSAEIFSVLCPSPPWPSAAAAVVVS